MPSRPPLVQLSVSLALVMLSVAGCEHGDRAPTITQAEQKLTEQISMLVFQAMRTGGKDIKMTTQNEQGSHCPKGKVRRGITFTGMMITRERKPPTQVAALLLGVTEMAGLIGKGAYKINYVRGGDPTTKLYNASTRTNLTVDSPGPDKLIIQGSTNCLEVK